MPSPTATPTATPTPTLDELLDQLQEVVAEVRGLQPKRDVERRFITRQELEEFVAEEFAEDQEDIYKTQELFIALGIIDEGTDLFELIKSLFGEQIVGFFDTETELLSLVSDSPELGPRDQVTFAHEFAHALQQQHFDIHTLTEGVESDSERLGAIIALVEGDAVVTQILFMTEYPVGDLGEPEGSEIFDSAPHVIQRQLLFPYTDGARFVASLYRGGGGEAVNDAYLNPPASTAQILHPDVYLAGQEPLQVALPDLAETLGPEWEQVDEDTLGEFFIRAYLEMGIADDQAALSAAGWRGDRFVLYQDQEGQGRQALVATSEDGDEAQEFFQGYIQFREELLEGLWENPEEDATINNWIGPDQVVHLLRNDATILLIIAPAQDILEDVKPELVASLG